MDDATAASGPGSPPTSGRGEAGQPVRGSALEVFAVALRLGLTSFGGPVAHLGYFRREYVDRRGWVDESTFADLVGLAQALPGPASSQLGMAIGTIRAGLPGTLAAWFGFTLPSALLMFAVAAGALREVPFQAGLIAGLQLAAVAVVAQALLTMARRLTPDAPRVGVAAAAAALALAVPTAFTQVAVILAGAAVGRLALGRLRVSRPPDDGAFAAVAAIEHGAVGPRTAALALVVFILALVGLPLLAILAVGHAVDLAWAFYRAGALVFGGGHVVLPLLQASVVEPAWVDQDAFLAGYGAAQALPGPLFSFAAFLGAVEGPAPNGLVGGSIALGAIFLPGALLVLAVLPVWSRLRASPAARSALLGVDAAVVGLLGAALWDPVIRTGIRRPVDALVALAAFAALLTGRVPPIVVVAACALVGVLGAPVAPG